MNNAMATIAADAERPPLRNNGSGEVLGAAFRSAMRGFAATVSIVTTRDRGACHGMTATAVTALTVAPPALVVCINRAASIHEHVHRVGQFCVNLLGTGHAALCVAFSGSLKGQERFSIGEWRVDGPEMPFLETAQAHVFCRVENASTYGTHTIFIGSVEAVRVDGAARPLVYCDGTVGRFSPGTAKTPFEN